MSDQRDYINGKANTFFAVLSSSDPTAIHFHTHRITKFPVHIGPLSNYVLRRDNQHLQFSVSLTRFSPHPLDRRLDAVEQRPEIFVPGRQISIESASLPRIDVSLRIVDEKRLGGNDARRLDHPTENLRTGLDQSHLVRQEQPVEIGVDRQSLLAEYPVFHIGHHNGIGIAEHKEAESPATQIEQHVEFVVGYVEQEAAQGRVDRSRL